MSETIVAPARSRSRRRPSRSAGRAGASRARRTVDSSRGRASSSTTSGGTTWATPPTSAPLRPRDHPLGRRLAGAGAAGRVRHAHGRRGRDPHRPLLPALDAARLGDQGLRARRRPRAVRRRPGRDRRRRDARARPRRRGAGRGRVRAAARDHGRPPRARRRARR